MSLERSIKRRMESERMESEKRADGARSGFTRSFMRYMCRSCGSEWNMYLETGLEEGGKNNKPVPFFVLCSCGELAQDVSGLINLYEPMKITDGMSYFANRKDSDCGVPVLRR